MGVVRWDSSKIAVPPPPTSSINTCAPVTAGSNSAGVPAGTDTLPRMTRTSSPDGGVTRFTVSTAISIAVPPTHTGSGNVVEVVVVVAPSIVVVVLVVAPGSVVEVVVGGAVGAS